MVLQVPDVLAHFLTIYFSRKKIVKEEVKRLKEKVAIYKIATHKRNRKGRKINLESQTVGKI